MKFSDNNNMIKTIILFNLFHITNITRKTSALTSLQLREFATRLRSNLFVIILTIISENFRLLRPSQGSSCSLPFGTGDMISEILSSSID